MNPRSAAALDRATASSDTARAVGALVQIVATLRARLDEAEARIRALEAARR